MKILQCVLFCAALLCCSCFAVKGYPGPERPSEELSRLYIGAVDPQVVRLQSIVIDSETISLYNTGIDILPGDHTIKVEVSTNHGVCGDKNPGETCYDVNYLGSCEGSFTTEQGESYFLEIQGIGRTVSYQVTAKDTAKNKERRVAGGSCDIQSLFEPLR